MSAWRRILLNRLASNYLNNSFWFWQNLTVIFDANHVEEKREKAWWIDEWWMSLKCPNHRLLRTHNKYQTWEQNLTIKLFIVCQPLQFVVQIQIFISLRHSSFNPRITVLQVVLHLLNILLQLNLVIGWWAEDGTIFSCCDWISLT